MAEEGLSHPHHPERRSRFDDPWKSDIETRVNAMENDLSTNTEICKRIDQRTEFIAEAVKALRIIGLVFRFCVKWVKVVGSCIVTLAAAYAAFKTFMNH